MRVFADLLLMFGSFAVLGFCGWQLVRIAKRKGYRSPLVGVCVLVAMMIGFFVGLDAHEEAESLTATTARSFSAAVLVCGLGMIVVWVFPHKDPRRPGPRRIRFPFRFAGYVLVGVGLVLAPVTNLATLSSALPLASICFWMARRAAAPSLEDVMAADPRAPVLYLRPFEREQHAFAMIPWGKRHEDFYTVGARHRLEWSTNPTLEQYLSEDVRRTVGPLVALGNPRDFAPLTGAARTYSSDDEWEEAFRSLAQPAACILSGVNIAPSLSQELRYLREAGLQEKLFIVSSPCLMDTRPRGLQQRAFRLWMRFNDKLTMWMKARPAWGRFVGTLRGLGYIVDLRAPRPGAVLTFDEEGKAILLRTGARTASDYIDTIQTWMTGRRTLPRRRKPGASLRGET